jgi:hypothetical protein
MKKIIISGLVLLVLGATWGMAQESKKEEQAGMHGMMQEMMKSETGVDPHRMMQDIQGMMSMMMKMMDQCGTMMKSSHGYEQPTEKPSK